MKQNKLLSFVLITSFLLLTFHGCEDEDPDVEPISIYEKVIGTWSLNTITQIDEISGEELALEGQLGFGTFNLTLNGDTINHEPTSFEVTGEAPELFITSGYWELNARFPTLSDNPVSIRLYADEAKKQVIDSLTFVAIPTGETGSQMGVKLTRKGASQVAFVSYDYRLTKQ